jgi:hypothetical protein
MICCGGRVKNLRAPNGPFSKSVAVLELWNLGEAFIIYENSNMDDSITDQRGVQHVNQHVSRCDLFYK